MVAGPVEGKASVEHSCIEQSHFVALGWDDQYPSLVVGAESRLSMVRERCGAVPAGARTFIFGDLLELGCLGEPQQIVWIKRVQVNHVDFQYRAFEVCRFRIACAGRPGVTLRMVSISLLRWVSLGSNRRSALANGR